MLHGGHSVRCALRLNPDAAEAPGNSRDVVVVVGSQLHLDQPPRRGFHDPQLPAAVEGAEPAIVFGGEAELGVIGDRFRDVGHADRDRTESVKSHIVLPSCDVAAAATKRCLSSPIPSA